MVYVFLSIWLVSFLVYLAGVFVGVDSDYSGEVLPHLKTGRITADSLPVMGKLCRVLKLCNLAAELSSLFYFTGTALSVRPRPVRESACILFSDRNMCASRFV